jgi:hypothetical protein
MGHRIDALAADDRATRLDEGSDPRIGGLRASDG